MFNKFRERHKEMYGDRSKAVAGVEDIEAEKETLTIDRFARLAEDPQMAEFVTAWMHHREAPDQTSNVHMTNAEQHILEYLSDNNYQVTGEDVRAFLEGYHSDGQMAA